MNDSNDDVIAAYAQARHRFIDDLAELRQGRFVWQMVALTAGILAVLGVVGVVTIATRHNVVPWIVELDPQQTIVRTYPAEPLLPPSAQHTRASLGRWIQTWRAVSPDPHVIRARVEYQFAILQKGSPAAARIKVWMRENDPFVRARKETVAVEINSVVKAEGKSWQVEWRETTYNRRGVETATTRYSAVVIVEHGKPLEDSILLNPGGLYISEIDWQQAWVDD